MSVVESPIFENLLPKYMKWSTFSNTVPLTIISTLLSVKSKIFVLVVFILRPTCFASSLSLITFSWAWCCKELKRATTSALLGSSKQELFSYYLPSCFLAVYLLNTQSIAIPHTHANIANEK
jgi:hypothetical protein